MTEQQNDDRPIDGPLAGVRVVELGLWLAGPACASILADWAADVVKIEPLAGDPFRGLAWAYGGEMNPPFELDNRGKRSVALDLRSDGGQEVLAALLADADIFVTNYRPGGLERLGLDWPTLHERYPQLIDARLVRLGPRLYLDTWRWSSRQAAIDAFEQRERVAGYRRWDSLVEILRFDEGVLVASDP